MLVLAMAACIVSPSELFSEDTASSWVYTVPDDTPEPEIPVEAMCGGGDGLLTARLFMTGDVSGEMTAFLNDFGRAQFDGAVHLGGIPYVAALELECLRADEMTIPVELDLSTTSVASSTWGAGTLIVLVANGTGAWLVETEDGTWSGDFFVVIEPYGEDGEG